jgi:hypothetical protein
LTQKLNHPAAYIFPLTVGEDFEMLALWMSREHSLREPALHTYGSILDSGHRYRGCQQLEIEARYVIWQGAPGTEVEFIASMNLHRRHRDASQRVMIGVPLATMRQGERTDLAPFGARSSRTFSPSSDSATLWQ